MLEHAARIGITHLVTTPHHSDLYAPEEDAVARGLTELRGRLSGAAAALQIIVGREISLTDQHVRSVQHLAHLRIGGGTLVLVELPEGLNRVAILEGCSALLMAGIRPVIAHPERNFIIQNAPEVVAELRLRGAAVQVNAASFAGLHGAAAQRAAWHLLHQQCVDVLGSDAHRARDYTAYAKACQIIMRDAGAVQMHEMIGTVPARLLQLS